MPRFASLTSSWVAVAIVGTLAGLTSRADAQPGRSGATASRTDETAATVRRSDLARAYLAFETAYHEHPPARSRVVEVNRAFDAVTLQFFAGDSAAVLRSLDELTTSLYPEGSTSLASRIARSLRLRSTPSNPVAASGRELELAIEPLYAVDFGGASSVELEVRVAVGTASLARMTLRATKEQPLVGGRLVVPAGAITADASAIHVQVRATDANEMVRSERIPVLPSDPDRVRASGVEFLDGLPEVAGLGDERSIFAARNDLLDSGIVEGSGGPVPLDRSVLLRELGRERAALAEGDDPYRGIEGHSWRVVRVGSIRVPLCLYVPESVEIDGPAVPLVIALHGAGGDENMFVRGYGAGKLCRLADAYGFVVASPQTFAFGSAAAAFDRLVASVRDDYAIDERRIYLIGHSFGAGIASALALRHADRIAAFCTIAGARASADREGAPPQLRIHGALDPLARGRGVTPRSRGRVRDRVFDELGHTLVVGAALPEVVGWLMAHRLESDD